MDWAKYSNEVTALDDIAVQEGDQHLVLCLIRIPGCLSPVLHHMHKVLTELFRTCALPYPHHNVMAMGLSLKAQMYGVLILDLVVNRVTNVCDVLEKAVEKGSSSPAAELIDLLLELVDRLRRFRGLRVYLVG